MPTKGSDKPTRPQKTALDDMFHTSLARVKPTKDRTTQLLQSPNRKMYERELMRVNRRYLGPPNMYEKIRTYDQTFLEPDNLYRSLPAQIKILTGDTFQGEEFADADYPPMKKFRGGIYFPDAAIDGDYAQFRLSVSGESATLRNFHRIPVLKMSFLERHFRIENAYKQPGMLLDFVNDCLNEQHTPIAIDTGYTKDPGYIRWRKDAEEIRREVEQQVPGDVMFIDVDTSNWVIGRHKKLYSTGYCREEVMASDDVFALSTFDVGILALMNSKRFTEFSIGVSAVNEVCTIPGDEQPYTILFLGAARFSRAANMQIQPDAASNGPTVVPAIGLHPNVTEYI